jgi:hypothetical protein
MLIDPKNSWKYAFNPLKVIAMRGERDYTVLLMEGGGEVFISNMGFNELHDLINKAQCATTDSKVDTAK